MAGNWAPIAIMLGARHNQVGKCMLPIMEGPNWQVWTSGEGDDFGDKSTRGVFFHHQQYPLNSYYFQISSCVGIGKPDNSLDSMQTVV